MTELILYFGRILPGMILGGILIVFFRKKSLLMVMTLFILLFLFTRDVMTPMKLWRFGTEGFFWLRFFPDPIVLICLGLMSGSMVFIMNIIAPELKKLLVWFKGNHAAGLCAGAAGAIVVTLPLILIYQGTDQILRGGAIPLTLLPAVGVIAFLGNFYEEVLFRGYLQGWMEEKLEIQPVKAAVISGIFFSFGHIFLAYSVTDIGLPILIFAAYEGIVCGLIRMKWGVIPAVLTHGGAIFILASGIF